MTAVTLKWVWLSRLIERANITQTLAGRTVPYCCRRMTWRFGYISWSTLDLLMPALQRRVKQARAFPSAYTPGEALYQHIIQGTAPTRQSRHSRRCLAPPLPRKTTLDDVCFDVFDRRQKTPEKRVLIFSSRGTGYEPSSLLYLILGNDSSPSRYSFFPRGST